MKLMGDVSSVHNLLEYLYGLAFLQRIEMKFGQNNIIFYMLIKYNESISNSKFSNRCIEK